MQQAASFNLQAVKEKVEQMMKSHEGQMNERDASAGRVG